MLDIDISYKTEGNVIYVRLDRNGSTNTGSPMWHGHVLTLGQMVCQKFSSQAEVSTELLLIKNNIANFIPMKTHKLTNLSDINSLFTEQKITKFL